MKRYIGMMFILLIGLATGFLISNITACGISGASSGYYSSGVHYSSGWGNYYHRPHHHRRPPPRRRR